MTERVSLSVWYITMGHSCVFVCVTTDNSKVDVDSALTFKQTQILLVNRSLVQTNVSVIHLALLVFLAARKICFAFVQCKNKISWNYHLVTKLVVIVMFLETNQWHCMTYFVQRTYFNIHNMQRVVYDNWLRKFCLQEFNDRARCCFLPSKFARWILLSLLGVLFTMSKPMPTTVTRIYWNYSN